MSPDLRDIALRVMVVVGAIIAPTVTADALTDLADLKYIIGTAASRIGSPTNSSRNWGGLGLLWPGSSGQMGTADLVANISTTILQANVNLGQNVGRWITVEPANGTGTPINLNQTADGIDRPYIDYVNEIPSLSAALTALGRSWHTEFNSPVYDAIGTLQSTMNAFSTSLIELGLLKTFTSTIRTNRAASSLESAQVAWSRILNLPGPGPEAPGTTPSPLLPAPPSPPQTGSPSPSPGGFFPRIPGLSPREALRRRQEEAPTLIDVTEPAPQGADGELPSGPFEPAVPAEPPTIVEIAYEDAQAVSEAEKRAEKDDSSSPARSLRGGGFPPHGFYTHKQLWGRAEKDAREQAKATQPVITDAPVLVPEHTFHTVIVHEGKERTEIAAHGWWNQANAEVKTNSGRIEVSKSGWWDHAKRQAQTEHIEADQAEGKLRIEKTVNGWWDQAQEMEPTEISGHASTTATVTGGGDAVPTNGPSG